MNISIRLLQMKPPENILLGKYSYDYVLLTYNIYCLYTDHHKHVSLLYESIDTNVFSSLKQNLMLIHNSLKSGIVFNITKCPLRLC